MISIDPGVHSAGLALWENETLTKACFVDVTRGTKLAKAYAGCLFLLFQALNDEITIAWDPDPTHVQIVIEMPQTYGGRASRGNTNDLLDLSRQVGVIAYGLARRFASAVGLRLVSPHEWKGTTPKEQMTLRIQRFLTPVELDRVVLSSAKSKHHNVFDAVGIGLFALGRLPRR